MLKLLRISEDDLERIMRWRMLPEVTKYMFTDPTLTMESQKHWFGTIVNDPTCLHWIIELDGVKIGTVNLTQIDSISGRCSWGYYIADTSLRGMGIGRALEYNVFDFVFYELKLNKLISEVLDFNHTVINLKKSCGSQVDGILRQHIKKQDRYYDVIVLSILRDEWIQSRKSLLYKKIPIES